MKKIFGIILMIIGGLIMFSILYRLPNTIIEINEKFKTENLDYAVAYLMGRGISIIIGVLFIIAGNKLRKSNVS